MTRYRPSCHHARHSTLVNTSPQEPRMFTPIGLRTAGVGSSTVMDCKPEIVVRPAAAAGS